MYYRWEIGQMWILMRLPWLRQRDLWCCYGLISQRLTGDIERVVLSQLLIVCLCDVCGSTPPPPPPPHSVHSVEVRHLRPVVLTNASPPTLAVGRLPCWPAWPVVNWCGNGLGLDNLVSREATQRGVNYHTGTKRYCKGKGSGFI